MVVHRGDNIRWSDQLDTYWRYTVVIQTLGIDPGLNATGFAWREASGEWFTSTSPGRDIKACHLEITTAHQKGCTRVIIEAGFHGPNQKTTLQLQLLRGELKMHCWYCGFREENIEFVMPRIWHQDIIRVPAADVKAASVQIATQLGADVYYNRPRAGRTADHNQADAVCMSEWGTRQLELNL